MFVQFVLRTRIYLENDEKYYFYTLQIAHLLSFFITALNINSPAIIITLIAARIYLRQSKMIYLIKMEGSILSLL